MFDVSKFAQPKVGYYTLFIRLHHRLCPLRAVSTKSISSVVPLHCGVGEAYISRTLALFKYGHMSQWASLTYFPLTKLTQEMFQRRLLSGIYFVGLEHTVPR